MKFDAMQDCDLQLVREKNVKTVCTCQLQLVNCMLPAHKQQENKRSKLRLGRLFYVLALFRAKCVPR